MAESPDVVMQRLHDEHAGALWGHCLRLTNHDRARAEDVCQETLLRAWRNASLLDERPGVGPGLAVHGRSQHRDRRVAHQARPLGVPGGRGARAGAHRRPERRAADDLGGRRRGHPPVRRAPRRAPGVLLQRSLGRRGGPPPRRSPRAPSSRAPTTPSAPSGSPWKRWGWSHEYLHAPTPPGTAPTSSARSRRPTAGSSRATWTAATRARAPCVTSPGCPACWAGWSPEVFDEGEPEPVPDTLLPRLVDAPCTAVSAGVPGSRRVWPPRPRSW